MMKYRKSILPLCMLVLAATLSAQELPLMGAQVFIEPGQTEAETDLWFKTLRDNGMEICRIRMFESYMLQPDGTWDFSLFDRAFEKAEKYNIKVMGTFFPATEKTDIGGWKFPQDEHQLQQFATYIKQLTTHFKNYKSLFAWVLINEPGGGLKTNAFSEKMRYEWELANPVVDFSKNGYPVLVNLQEGRFEKYMTSWMLNWIAEEVRKNDPHIHLHVNNHAIFDNLPEYDFPYWRTFLNSLGGSAHAGWHFGLFRRNQYTLAMSANSEILLSGAGHLPWIMTEIQGGNNTFSAQNPMCPTKEEITQWLWTIIGTAGKGGIFWSLNPRTSGVESGEWALLDFQHQPTDRVEAVKQVNKCLLENKELFQQVEKADPKINLLYFRESLWAENVITKNTPADSDGRKSGLKNLLGYFKAFSETGITPNIAAFEEFDFTKKSYEGESIILANQIAIPDHSISQLEEFVKKGGKLWVDGLTGYYDENLICRFLIKSPLENLLGGKISEFKHSDDQETILINQISLPVSMWTGHIRPNSGAEVVAQHGNNVVAIKNTYGSGEVVWVPSLAGIPAWQNAASLSSLLKQEFFLHQKPFFFEHYHPDIMMKTLASGEKYITIIVNKSGKAQQIKLKGEATPFSPKVIFNNFGGTITNKVVNISSEETLVVVWK